MKAPLQYQVTEVDCAAATLVNALTVLFKREELNIKILKELYTILMDKGVLGTSEEALLQAIARITDYVPLHYSVIENSEKRLKCHISSAFESDNNCVAILRVYLGVDEHYVLCTSVTDTHLLLFDPYFTGKLHDVNDLHNISITLPLPIVGDYSLVKGRRCILLWK